ncbi:hypothetical protein K502DRAFT_368675 [Neoconidiobolus thromboides FSU 785]|nr:hypothetical protein K502DRAFT_368675 [Neoconidiobolus thromboides FSU 785]
MSQRSLKPSEFDAKYSKTIAKQGEQTKKLIDDIPEDEKWRLIKQSGILDKVKEKEEKVDFTKPPPDDFIFDSIIYSIPFTTFYSIMELLIFKQYGEPFEILDLIKCFIRIFPALCFFIYVTNKHRGNRYVKMGLLLAGLACGVKLMTLMKGRPTLGEMKSSAGLSTLWAYTAFQLDFVPCLISVLTPALFYLYQN